MTIGVWVGRPDGTPVPGLVGRIAAAPILFDAFARTGQPLEALPRAPKGVDLRLHRPGCRRLCSASARPACRARWASRRASCSRPTARDWNSPAASDPDPLALKIAGGRRPLTVMVNGVPLPARAAGTRCSSGPTGRALRG